MPFAKSNVKAALTINGHRSVLFTPALVCPRSGAHLSPLTILLWPFAHTASHAGNKKGNYIWAPLSDKQHVWCYPFSVTLSTCQVSLFSSQEGETEVQRREMTHLSTKPRLI